MWVFGIFPLLGFILPGANPRVSLAICGVGLAVNSRWVIRSDAVESKN
jgi:hypothetical protein